MKKTPYKSGQLALTVPQVERLLANIITLEDECLMKLAISTGIRRADIVKIIDDNIDFEEGYVEFAESKKKGKVKRTYLPFDMLNTIKKWQAVKPKNNRYLFPRKDSKTHISDRTVYNRLQANLKRAGLPNRPFHALRATAYKVAQAKGWSARQAAEHIGDSTRVAEEHYGAPSTEEMKSKAREMPLI